MRFPELEQLELVPHVIARHYQRHTFQGSPQPRATIRELLSFELVMSDTLLLEHIASDAPLQNITASTTAGIGSPRARGSQSPNAGFAGSCVTPSNAQHRWTFEGQVVTFPDGARWQLSEPLSSVKLQQVNAPCEGTQVFTCVRLDSSENHAVEAVMKIKFQYVYSIT
jgi:hypothetical protein